MPKDFASKGSYSNSFNIEFETIWMSIVVQKNIG